MNARHLYRHWARRLINKTLDLTDWLTDAAVVPALKQIIVNFFCYVWFPFTTSFKKVFGQFIKTVIERVLSFYGSNSISTVFHWQGVYTIQQTSSRRPANVEQLARVFWIHLLEVCWTFAGTCKRGITMLLVLQVTSCVTVGRHRLHRDSRCRRTFAFGQWKSPIHVTFTITSAGRCRSISSN